MKFTLAVYGSIVALVVVVLAVVLATGGINLDLRSDPPVGELAIMEFARENPRIVVVGEIDCRLDASCTATGVRAAPGITLFEAQGREPNIELSYDPQSGDVLVMPLPPPAR